MKRCTDPHPPVLLIGGPTAAGKSGLAIEIAEAYGAVVVSADAMTVYRGLDIGTAKPTPQERERVAHHCIDVRELHEEFNVSDFVAEVDRVRGSNPRVIIAGGTPFYLAALVRPMAVLPAPDPQIRSELEALGDPWGLLSEVDPVMAQKLHPNDRVRVVRALEVFRITGSPMSVVQSGPPSRPPIAAEVIWLDRDDLRERINARIEQMVARGYVEETRAATQKHAHSRPRALRSFAYRHIVDHLHEGLPLPEAMRRTERDTWHLARKQRMWARGMGWSTAEPMEGWEAAARIWNTIAD